ncbi:hypothetical protein [Maribacter stanieri]|uniref:Lipoprotein n=1 Tax=Maribacter stanieri TaxID=440514 RepID=A0A1I6JUF8_9FLAO|nr:hypothetical protein [Maribacter stanieri]SFR82645.1 hypothetical protein SAMN04488010_3064 [Maribacter stanieri]|tara:strand:+ start:6702 stop:7379 length:678 start_codon:yes stop_codon:yes gene_type:complete
MKKLLSALIFGGLLISCNTSDKSKSASTENVENEKSKEVVSKIDKQLKPIETDEDLIATALMAAPAESRATSKVIGYNMAGEFVTLKEGDSEYIVLADDPKKDGFNAACYHKDLEPFMARGRALRAEGKSADEIFAIREAEVKSGKIKITQGSALHIYYGPNTSYGPETSKVDGAKLRYVIYTPFATSASIGLPETPSAPNHPWIMNPGTHRAHIMISPLENKEE